jgi:hypothetical protein
VAGIVTINKFEIGFKGSSMWGDAINWFPDFESRKVVGWKSPCPMVGDTLRVNMKSGKVLLCRFVTVDQKRDPSDMFFAVVRDIGYEGEPPFPRSFWQRLCEAAERILP